MLLSRTSHYDVLIVGGGIVGLATAYKLVQRGLKVRVMEKEPAVARHQSGRNSGVLHSGIYYRPGSMKARTCVAGRRQMEQFCEEKHIPWKRSGKVIVATHEGEIQRLHDLYERGVANGVDCALITTDELRDLEPHCAGISAVFVRDTGVVNYRAVCERLADNNVTTGARVTRIEQDSRSVKVTTAVGVFEGDQLINCAGLYADRIARLAGCEPGVQVVPFRGEYFDVTAEAAELCRTSVYPVVDPELPFLGVHFTRSIDDQVHCGPNAVLAFSREGYRLKDVNLIDLAEIVGYRGMRAVGRRMWRTGVGEFVRSFSKAAFVRAAQRLIPAIRAEHLVPAAAGVRAQAVKPDGTLLDDFLVKIEGRAIHVLNAPSPAATASLAIGDYIVDQFMKGTK